MKARYILPGLVLAAVMGILLSFSLFGGSPSMATVTGWRLLSSGVDGKSVVVLPSGFLTNCRWHHGEALRRADGSFEVAVSIRDRADCPEHSDAMRPPSALTVALPTSTQLAGQRIVGDRYEGTAAWPAKADRRYVSVEGLRLSVARQILQANGVRGTAVTIVGPDGQRSFVERQVPYPQILGSPQALHRSSAENAAFTLKTASR